MDDWNVGGLIMLGIATVLLVALMMYWHHRTERIDETVNANNKQLRRELDRLKDKDDG